VADRHADVLLVGGGVASAACAVALREGGFGGSVVLAGREPDPPYSRPPASKGYLSGAQGRDDALYRPEAWYADHDVELLTRVSVMKMDTGQRTVKLSDRSELSYGSALLATGANVRRLNVDGADLDGIHYLRALRNADTIRSDVQDAGEVVLIGGSYIGCEVAATLTAMGKRCTVVMQEPVALSRGFGEQAGRHLQRVLEAHGVTFVGEATVERFEGSGERVEKVVLQGGRELAADAVVLGVGAVPDVMLARAAKLELGLLGGAGRLGGGGHVRVSLRAPRRTRAHRALRGGRRARAYGRRQPAGRGPPPRGGPLLLERPGRLVLAGVGRLRARRVGRGGRARLLRRRGVHGLVPARWPPGHRAQRRPLGRPR
jgi:3-phenylpropionate/trans-cinnamate dioxygenase ferredoxin reductase subunit